MSKRVWIFGIGKFGDSFVSGILNESDLNLALVDKNKNKIAKFADQNIPLHVCDFEIADNVDYLGLEKNDFCLVLMSSNVGASILVTQNLIESKVNIGNIFIRVINPQHKRILKSLGIQKFIDPDQMIANKIILEITKKIDITYFDSENYIFKIINNKIEGEKIKNLKNLEQYKINILLIFRDVSSAKKKVIYPLGETTINKEDQILLLVPKDRIDKVNNIFRKF